jgi:hypothetical protein
MTVVEKEEKKVIFSEVLYFEHSLNFLFLLITIMLTFKVEFQCKIIFFGLGTLTVFSLMKGNLSQFLLPLCFLHA